MKLKDLKVGMEVALGNTRGSRYSRRNRTRAIINEIGVPAFDRCGYKICKPCSAEQAMTGVNVRVMRRGEFSLTQHVRPQEIVWTWAEQEAYNVKHDAEEAEMANREEARRDARIAMNQRLVALGVLELEPDSVSLGAHYRNRRDPLRNLTAEGLEKLVEMAEDFAIIEED